MKLNQKSKEREQEDQEEIEFSRLSWVQNGTEWLASQWQLTTGQQYPSLLAVLKGIIKEAQLFHTSKINTNNHYNKNNQLLK